MNWSTILTLSYFWHLLWELIIVLSIIPKHMGFGLKQSNIYTLFISIKVYFESDLFIQFMYW